MCVGVHMVDMFRCAYDMCVWVRIWWIRLGVHMTCVGVHMMDMFRCAYDMCVWGVHMVDMFRCAYDMCVWVCI